MNLQELIAKIVADAKGEMVAVAYEGVKVEHDGEVWYQLLIADHGGYYTVWYADIDGEAVYYDRDRIAPEDRIAEIDATIPRYDAEV